MFALTRASLLALPLDFTRIGLKFDVHVTPQDRRSKSGSSFTE